MTTTWVAQQRTLQDDTTRYLCAAAHVDSAYADAAIKEFVVEPTRPIPPSPGFHPASVLVEAIASRTRRKIRDSTLIVLMGCYLWTAWGSWLLYGWIALAVLVALPSMIRGMAAPASRMVSLSVAIGVVLALVIGFASGGLESLLGSNSRESHYYGDSGGSSDSDVWVAVSLIPFALMLVVLLVDRLLVRNLITSRFGYGTRNLPPSDPFNRQRQVLSFSPPGFIRHLDRYRMAGAPAPGGAPLIVHRGYNPFVGAGLHREPWSMALPLEKLPEATKPDGSEFDQLTTISLYDRVRTAMSVLQASTALSPDRRLRDLKIIEAVYASSGELVDHLHEPASTAYLSTPDYPPNEYLPSEEVSALRAQPREWARYYLCFQVETWDRDLVMSTFLHAAVDESTLYLEWTPCVLPPVRDQYRAIDKMTPSVAVPMGQALLRWLKLPASIIGRTVHTLALIRPLRRERGVINPDAYGSLRTLREMAAAREVSSYFQLVDIERYEKIMHSRLVPAISRILRDCGYSPATFERQAETVINGGITIERNYGSVNAGGTVLGDMSGATTDKGVALK
jgi:hypothetical protein